MLAVVRSIALALAGGLTALGCSGEDDETAEVVDLAGCLAGEWRRDDGSCLRAGLPPDMPCPPGEWLRDDGSCIPAGVPPDGCGEGFVHDGDRGCEPILPAEPCTSGLMAVPGDRSCREVAPCAAGKWGDIPVEPDTEYVDANYAGMDSDGSALKPWPSIQAAVDAALPGAIVAIAAGSYLEDVTVRGKPARLWGVCPALVEVVGTGTELAAVNFLEDAAGSEVQRLAIRGDAFGVITGDSLDVLIERVWVHDVASRGIDVESYFPTSATIRASLVERSVGAGLVVFGSPVTVEESVVRDVQLDLVNRLLGRGVSIQPSTLGETPATLLMRRSLIERNHQAGVYAEGTDVTIEGSVVRETRDDGEGVAGRDVVAQVRPTTGAPTTLVLHTSLIERSEDGSMFLSGSHGTVEASVVRDTLLSRGISAQRSQATGAPSTLLLRTSLIERTGEMGIFVDGSEATIEASVVRDTQLDALGDSGRGVNVQPREGAPATLMMRTSLVETSRELGVFIAGSQATVEATLVRDTQPDGHGHSGQGMSVQSNPATAEPSTFLMRASLIEQSREVGLYLEGSVATLESCLIRDSATNTEGLHGDGIVVMSDPAPATATILATRIERSARAGISAHGAHAAVGGSALLCQTFDLDYETYRTRVAKLEDLGGNVCGCPEATGDCHAVSTGLQAPPPLGPAGSR